MKRTSFDQIKVGDYLSETQYYKVVSKNDEQVTILNERGFDMFITKAVVEEGAYSANQHTRVEKVSRTRLVELLESAGDTIFTVHFTKQPNETAMRNKLQKVKLEDFSKKNFYRQLAKDLSTGEERTLIGYLMRCEPKMGRSQVIDMEIGHDKHRLRQVDHRTIQWLILKNVKYEVA
jgi:hypothetical protein